MSTLNLGLIGNCEIAALVDPMARIVWCCLPRFDGDPVFNALLGGQRSEEMGYFAVELVGAARSTRRYLPNTPILETEIWTAAGDGIRITDHVPRYERYGRIYRPAAIYRHVEPIGGTPRVTLKVRPSHGYGAHRPTTTRGSNHIRYVLDEQVLRLTTNAPVDHVINETVFVLTKPVTLILGPDETLQESVAETERRSRDATARDWREWVRRLAIPFEWQEVVIRSAITLKLCSYEQTGAIVAALTTSVPEYGTPGRNWDYRLCWLRDSFFVVQALNRLGATAVMERYLAYVTNLVAASPNGYLQPLFGLSYEADLTESVVEGLPGYRDLGPVRIGNDAYRQVQNDGYGSVVLSIAQVFFDQRVDQVGDEALFRLLEPLGKQAARRWNEPDAGVWEYRTRTGIHTHSSVMCWVACDRLARIAEHLGLEAERQTWRAAAIHIRDGILDRAWNPLLNTITSTFDGADVDASLLLLPELGFIEHNDPRFLGTLAMIEKRLRRGNHVFRYADTDDFGVPESAFTVCTLWLAEALARVGRQEEARAVFEAVLAARNDLGLLSEGLDVVTGELWGNFPQTYSMVGLVRVARRLSKPWEDAF